MDQFFQFIINHWLLAGLFLALLIVLLFEESRVQGAGQFGLTPEALTQMINRDNVTIVDVRDANAFKEGAIIGSLNIPADNIDQSLKRIEKNKQNSVVVVCTTSQRANQVAKQLRSKGFEKVYVLNGGLQAWKSADMPVVRKSNNGKN